jgi:hypothetical protein
MNANKQDDKYPKGYFLGMWTGIGIAIFSGVGIPISIVTENFAFIGIGPAIGVSIGIAVGQSLENKYENEGRLRPLTDAENRNRKTMILIAAGIVALGVLVFLLLLLRR